MKTRRLIITSVLALFVVVGAAVPRAQAQDLPDGDGKDVVVKACTSCHDADNFTSKKHTKAEWKEVVDTMVAYGAEISDANVDVITTYLAKNFGKGEAPAAGPAASNGGGAAAGGLADGPGKDVVMKVCTTCHDTDNITMAKHTKAEWKDVVTTMVGYGAEVSDAQMEVITTYLATYYGKGGAARNKPAAHEIVVAAARPRH